MKRQLSIYGVLAALAFSVQGLAADCYLNQDCDAGEICINLECAAPTDDMDSCDSDDDCSHLFTCTDGVCLPEGVYCKSDTGFGVFTVTGTTLECGGGMGRVGITTGSSSGSSSGSGSDMVCDEDGDCSPPTVEELTPAELQNLYDNCINDVENSCGTEVPVPEEECSPGALQICTDWFTYGADRLEECEDVLGDIYEANHPDGDANDVVDPGSPPSVGSESDGDEDMSDGKDIDVEAPDEDIEESGGADAAPSISGLFSMTGRMRGLAADANPWQVVECCNAFDDEETEDEADMITETTACFMENENGGCEDLYDCVTPMFEYYGYGDSTAMGSRDNEAGDVGGDDELAQADNGKNADDGDSAGEENADDSNDGGSSDSGCSIATPGTQLGSIMSLIF